MNVRARRLFAKLALAGLAGYVACLLRHWCQCGHMEHPPYAWWDYALDVSWVILFTSAAVMSVVGWGVEQIVWPLLLGGLVATRFLLPHTMGLSVICFEVPGSLALLVRSICVLLARRHRGGAATASSAEPTQNEETG